MRVLKLTDAVTAKLLSARHSGDAAADRVASRIIADLRRRGDTALLGWTRKLDGLQLTPLRGKRAGSRKTLWLSPSEIERGAREVSPQFRETLQHAARNIRRVAEQQLPREWSI